MEPDKMDDKTTCERFYCPTLNHINQLLEKVHIKQNPEKIFLHCGTNHIYIVEIRVQLN